jgi:hypothetical protein
MRTATILATALAAAIAVTAAPAQKIAFTKPLWNWPPDLEKFEQTWREEPAALAQPEAPPVIVIPPDTALPDENHLHRGPDSEEWHCLVPLQRAPAAPPALPDIVPTTPNRCQTPSADDQLLHLL